MEPKATETEAGVSTQETSVSVPETFDFTKFSVQRVLNEDCRSKVIFLQGKFEEKEGDAVVILEKQVFNREKIEGIFTACTAAKTKENDIYYKFVGQPNNEDFTGVKIDVVHPATTKHIEKYLKKKIFLVEETPELYRDVVLPYLKECGFSLQWVYNILEREAEVDKIVFEDVDPKIGFTLVHDDKWDGVTVDNLHLLAISRDRKIGSLRDLRGEHIALLENIRQNASVLVVGSEQIRIILGECSEDQAVDLFIDGANFIKIGTVINWTPTHVEVRLRTASAYIKQELTAFKTTKAPPALNAGVKYDLQCRSCLAVVAQGLCFGRILEKPQENDVSFFCHGHSGLQSKPRADDLLHDVSIFDIHGVSNVCASCAQQLGTAYQDRTSIWKFAVIWRDISSIPSDTLDLSAAALANFSSILVDACSDLPMCSVILISINDASQPPVPLKLFSAPLFMSATEYPAALPPPRAALGVLMEDQLDKQAVSLPMPQIVLLRGLEELKRNAAFLNLPCLTFVYI